MINVSEKWSMEFSTSGGMGPTANVVYKRISSMIAQKHDKTYSKTLHCIRWKLSYWLLRSAIMCLRRARSIIHHPTSLDTMDLPCHKGQVPLRTLNWTHIYSTPLYILNTFWLIEFPQWKKKEKRIKLHGHRGKNQLRGGKNQFPRW